MKSLRTIKKKMVAAAICVLLVLGIELSIAHIVHSVQNWSGAHHVLLAKAAQKGPARSVAHAFNESGLLCLVSSRESTNRRFRRIEAQRPAKRRQRGDIGFTLIEILSAIAIVAILAVALIFFTMSYIQWAQNVSDQKTLLVLNDALTRYKCEGGNVPALTAGAPISHVMSALQRPLTWGGTTHNVMQAGFTVPGKSLFAKGNGPSYRFTGFNTCATESGGKSPTTDVTSQNCSNLVFYYSMDSSTISGTTITDLSGNGNNGTLVGSPTSVTGEIGQALSFNGSSSQYINGPTTNATASVNNESIAAWVYWNGNPSAGSLAGIVYESSSPDNLNGHILLCGNPSSPTAVVGQTTYSAGSPSGSPSVSAAISANAWAHYVITNSYISGTQTAVLSIYKDGSLIQSQTTAGVTAFQNGGSNWRIGCQKLPSPLWPGYIDEVRIYNRALSAGEVFQLYNWWH